MTKYTNFIWFWSKLQGDVFAIFCVFFKCPLTDNHRAYAESFNGISHHPPFTALFATPDSPVTKMVEESVSGLVMEATLHHLVGPLVTD